MMKTALTLCSASAVSGLILRKAQDSVDPSVASDLWNVTRVGVDLPGVKSEYAATKESGELKADGFLPTGCFPDRNLKTRDLHGSETSYEGPVSVIKYEDVVAKTEREPMTQQVCYEFCRKFEQVKFFGVTNGSKCYCEPMFNVATAGNSGGCKVPCEGNPGQMCGGPDMSSIFEMHNCPPKERFTTDKMTKFTGLKTSVSELGEATKTCIDDLVKSGSKLVETQKQKGNTISMKHQKAFTQGYQDTIADLNALPFEAAKLAAELETALGTYSGLGANAKEAEVEKSMAAVELASEAIENAVPKLSQVFSECHPNITATGDAIGFYTSISEETSAQSCDGKFIGTPFIVSGTDPVDSCAQKCQNTMAPEQCVGFQVYKGLFSEYKGPTWRKVADDEHIGLCFEPGAMRYIDPNGNYFEMEHPGFVFYCGPQSQPMPNVVPGGQCECTDALSQVKEAGELCMLFSEIAGVTQYNKPDCPTTAPLEAKCYVPKTDLSAHQLHTKADTVSLPYCFDA